MENTRRRPGRPKTYSDLVPKTILLEFDLEQEIVVLANKTNRSFSDVCRAAIRAGLDAKAVDASRE